MKTALSGTKFLTFCFAVAALAGSAMADITHVALPGDVPDEQQPRGYGDAPAGWGPTSWQGPATGKSNWHARYLQDGDVLSILFPVEAAGLTIGDLASLSYYTKDLNLGDDNRDWWIQIYTRPTGVGDEAGWYGHKYTNNYDEHNNDGTWQFWSTDAGAMTFSGNSIGGELTLSQLQAARGGELIEMISIQTDSGWNGFNGYVDGLTITLNNPAGSVGRVNFEAVPAPGAALVCATGLGLLGWFRRRLG